ncbi:MAG: Rieske (2Fe-2S) protein [Acidimicrobiaceae bacterium]|nr:Rieske (2Fe-2S) protein [Acidimicrobiaceae bacterium]
MEVEGEGQLKRTDAHAESSVAADDGSVAVSAPDSRRTRHRLSDFSEPPPGEKAVATVAGRRVVIVNVAGTLRAVGATCAHQGGSLELGGVFDEVRARVDQEGRVVDFLAERGNVIACPWHGWEYDLRTGRCLWNSRYRVATYRVEREDDGGISVWV